MSVTEALVEWAVSLIDRLGYVGVFILMTLESMVAPIPSEGVMPFAGFLVAEGKMNLWIVALVATAGSLLGSWLSYEMGRHLGRPFILRWGRYVLVSEREMAWTEGFFHRWGTLSIFVGRFLPVVRHLISIPAGTARMRLIPFFLATAVGAFGWNLFLAWIGSLLGARWTTIRTWLEPVDWLVLLLLAAAVGGFVFVHWRRAKQNRPMASDAD